MSISEHRKLHPRGPAAIAKHRLTIARPEVAAKLGALRREEWKKVKAEPTGVPCIVCGGPVVSRAVGAKHKRTVCSRKCYAKQRRESGLDDIDFQCVVCGNWARANKYDKPKCCSLSCNTRLGNLIRYGKTS